MFGKTFDILSSIQYPLILSISTSMNVIYIRFARFQNEKYNIN